VETRVLEGWGGVEGKMEAKVGVGGGGAARWAPKKGEAPLKGMAREELVRLDAVVGEEGMGAAEAL
jgi:hypothetical protein